MEALFSESKSADDKARSCIWDKYNRGDVVPRVGIKPNGDLHLASRVEETFPGTLQWLTSPMWRLLDKAPMSMLEVKAVYENMPSDLRSLFVEPEYKIKGIFWKRISEPESCIEALRKFQPLPVFIALLTMVKEAEINQDQWTHYLALKTAIDVTEYLTLLPEIEMTSLDLEEYLTLRFDSAGYIQE